MTNLRYLGLGALALAAATIGAIGGAEAKKARCFTTDDGYFSCNFTATDKAGSFEIGAAGYPSYQLQVDQPGFAFGYINLGNRWISLPGQYVRSNDDGACWNNPETSTRICAW